MGLSSESVDPRNARGLGAPFYQFRDNVGDVRAQGPKPVALYLQRSIPETSLGDETMVGRLDGREVLPYRLGAHP